MCISCSGINIVAVNISCHWWHFIKHCRNTYNWSIKLNTTIYLN